MPFDETIEKARNQQAAERAARAEYMLRYGRAKGAIAVKGVMIRCARCGVETENTTDDPEFKAAWALTNLRPLWAADNIRKGPKRLFLI